MGAVVRVVDVAEDSYRFFFVGYSGVATCDVDDLPGADCQAAAGLPGVVETCGPLPIRAIVVVALVSIADAFTRVSDLLDDFDIAALGVAGHDRQR